MVENEGHYLDDAFNCNLWRTIGYPGFFGRTRDDQETEWSRTYGEGGWRVAWELANGEILGFDQIFWQVYVAGYTRYLLDHPEEVKYLSGFAYAYDKDLISRPDAFNPHALYGQPGRPNQFHHVALNIALEWFIGVPFTGQEPLQVRLGKVSVGRKEWPKGWRFSPGFIPTVRPDLIPDNQSTGWWQKGTIEDFYQATKVLQIKNNNHCF